MDLGPRGQGETMVRRGVTRRGVKVRGFFLVYFGVSSWEPRVRFHGLGRLFLSLFLSLSNVITFFPILILVHVAQP